LASVHRVPPRGVNSFFFFFTPGPSVHHLYPYRLKIFLRAPYTDFSIAIHLLFCFLLLHWSEKQGQIDKTIFRIFHYYSSCLLRNSVSGSFLFLKLGGQSSQLQTTCIFI
jgi:hypothetical protein